MTLSTRDLTEKLKALQEVDLEVRKLLKEDERWPAILEMRTAEVRKRETVQAEKEEAQKTLRMEIGAKESEIKAIEEGIVKANVTLNTVKTNKEYTAILNEIALKESEISTLEEEILRRMESIDLYEKDVEAARAAVRAAREELSKLEAQAAQEKKEIQEELQELEARRDDCREAVPGDVLDQYERIAEGRDGLAVVAAVEGVCQGCFINLTPQEVNLLMGAASLIRCKNCSRILYLDDR
ncbi:MAG: zinc ribbon domain-containing protein [Planctomycetota bacterium]|jgi:predicted  nucleic acid-binding Zn-ribbon protein